MNRWLLLLLNSTLAVVFIGIPSALAARLVVLAATSWRILQLWLPLGVPGFLAAVALPALAAVVVTASLGLVVGVCLAAVLARPLVGRRTLRKWLVGQTRLPGYARLVDRVLAAAYG